MIQIFDIVNDQVVPSAHCHIVPELKAIIDFYPEDYLQVFAYIQYTVILDFTQNIYMNIPEDEREEVVLADIKSRFGSINFSLECPIVLEAVEKCKKLFETPVDRHFLGVKHMTDKMARMLYTEEIVTTGKDANLTALRGAIKDAPELWKAYKEAAMQLQQEQSIARGKIRRAYDQLPTYRDLKTDDNE